MGPHPYEMLLKLEVEFVNRGGTFDNGFRFDKQIIRLVKLTSHWFHLLAKFKPKPA